MVVPVGAIQNTFRQAAPQAFYRNGPFTGARHAAQDVSRMAAERPVLAALIASGALTTAAIAGLGVADTQDGQTGAGEVGLNVANLVYGPGATAAGAGLGFLGTAEGQAMADLMAKVDPDASDYVQRSERSKVEKKYAKNVHAEMHKNGGTVEDAMNRLRSNRQRATLIGGLIGGGAGLIRANGNMQDES